MFFYPLQGVLSVCSEKKRTRLSKYEGNEVELHLRVRNKWKIRPGKFGRQQFYISTFANYVMLTKLHCCPHNTAFLKICNERKKINEKLLRNVLCLVVTISSTTSTQQATNVPWLIRISPFRLPDWIYYGAQDYQREWYEIKWVKLKSVCSRN